VIMDLAMFYKVVTKD